MPKAPRRLGARARQDGDRDYDAERRKARPWRDWYSKPQWKAIRLAQLDAEPLCRRCAAEGVVKAAAIVNHVGRHGGDWERFIAGPFESVCKPHHDSAIQREERVRPAR